MNGITIYYEVHGTGESLVIIAGLSIDITALESIISQLSHRYQVIAFDNRGAGRSDKPDIPYSIEMMADDTAALLKALKIAQAHMMGISLRGRIAIALTLKHPEMVKRLILVSTGAKVPNTLGRRLLFLLLEIPRRVGAFGKKHPQPYYAYVRQRKASENYDVTDRLQEIHSPTLILHGKKDRLAPYKWEEKMRVDIRNSKVITFKGGHTFLFWRQREFLNAVEDFVESQKTESSNRR